MKRGQGEVIGFVVREEFMERDPTTGVNKKRRRTVSRVYHARTAAEDFCHHCRKLKPEGVFYVHDKIGGDDADIR